MNQIRGFLTLTIWSACFFCKAQTPDFSFETWNTYPASGGAYEEPLGWVSFNELRQKLPVPITVERDSTPHTGSYAMKVMSKQFYNLSTMKNDTMFGLAYISFKGLDGATGYAYTKRPTSMKLFYKYFPVGKDTAVFQVLLSKAKGSSYDTIGYANVAIGGTVSSYTQLTVPIIYKSSSLPDTASIFLFSSKLSKAIANSKLVVDDIVFEVPAGVQDIEDASSRLLLYPIPATDKLNIVNNSNENLVLEIFNIAGKKLNTLRLSGINTQVDVSAYPSGIYYYSVTTSDSSKLSGKFSLVK